MYGLPEEFVGDFLLNKTCQIVSFTQNSVYLGFNEGISITILSSFATSLEDDVKQVVPILESNLMQLVGSNVMSVKTEPGGTLMLVFEEGHNLRVFDDQDCFESYSINDGQKEIYI